MTHGRRTKKPTGKSSTPPSSRRRRHPNDVDVDVDRSASPRKGGGKRPTPKAVLERAKNARMGEALSAAARAAEREAAERRRAEQQTSQGVMMPRATPDQVEVAEQRIAMIQEPVVPPSARPRRPRTTRTPVASRSSKVEQVSVPPAALAAALKIAGGDHSRLKFEADGSVTILNASRSA